VQLRNLWQANFIDAQNNRRSRTVQTPGYETFERIARPHSGTANTGTAGASPALSNGFTQGTFESDNPDDVAFNESGRGRPRSQEEVALEISTRSTSAKGGHSGPPSAS